MIDPSMVADWRNDDVTRAGLRMLEERRKVLLDGLIAVARSSTDYKVCGYAHALFELEGILNNLKEGTF